MKGETDRDKSRREIVDFLSLTFLLIEYLLLPLDRPVFDFLNF